MEPYSFTADKVISNKLGNIKHFHASSAGMTMCLPSLLQEMVRAVADHDLNTLFQVWGQGAVVIDICPLLSIIYNFKHRKSKRHLNVILSMKGNTDFGHA